MANAVEQIVVHHDHGNEAEIQNLPQATANGMPVRYEEHNLKQDIMTVAAGSTSFLSIDPATSEIAVSSLAITAVTVDTTNATIAAFVAANYTAGNEHQQGDLIVLTAATDFAQRNWIHNGGVAGTTDDFTRIQGDLVAADIRAMLGASGVLRYDAGTGVTSVAFGLGANELNGQLIPVDSSLFTTNQSDVEGMLVALEDLIEANDLAQTNLTAALGQRVDTLIGNGASASTLGSFTGTNKPDVNSSVKDAIQDVVDHVDAADARIGEHDGVLGVSSSATDMGAYTDTVCPDNASVKAVTQALGTSLQTEIANRTSDVATLNTAITNADSTSSAALALRTQMSVSTISLTANTALQVAHSFSTGFQVQVEDSNGRVVNPQVDKTSSNVTLTSEIDLTNAKLTLIGY